MMAHIVATPHFTTPKTAPLIFKSRPLSTSARAADSAHLARRATRHVAIDIIADARRDDARAMRRGAAYRAMATALFKDISRLPSAR